MGTFDPSIRLKDIVYSFAYRFASSISQGIFVRQRIIIKRIILGSIWIANDLRIEQVSGKVKMTLNAKIAMNDHEICRGIIVKTGQDKDKSDHYQPFNGLICITRRLYILDDLSTIWNDIY